MELSDAYRRYWRSKERDLSINTQNDYKRTFERFRLFLADRDVLELEAVTTEDVEDYLNDLTDQGLSPKTVSNHWTALSSLWTWAETKFKIPQQQNDQRGHRLDQSRGARVCPGGVRKHHCA